MAKRKEPEKAIDENFDAFEEWEGGDAEAQATTEALPPDQDMGDDLAAGDEPAYDPLQAEDLAAKADSPLVERPAAKGLADELAELAPDVPVNLVAVIGKTMVSVGQLMKCRIGQVIDLGRTPGETVDLVANGKLIARGELVEMDGKMGVRVLKMVR